MRPKKPVLSLIGYNHRESAGQPQSGTGEPRGDPPRHTPRHRDPERRRRGLQPPPASEGVTTTTTPGGSDSGREGDEMAEDKKVPLKGESKGRATASGKLTVHTFIEYLVDRRVGISSDKAHELQEYADKLTERREFSEADAWSLITSVEQWAQARTALKVAIGALVVSVVIGLCSVCVAFSSLLISIY